MTTWLKWLRTILRDALMAPTQTAFLNRAHLHQWEKTCLKQVVQPTTPVLFRTGTMKFSTTLTAPTPALKIVHCILRLEH